MTLTEKAAANMSASGTIGAAVGSGLGFYCTSLNVSGYNNSSVTAGQWTITDGAGGAIKAAGNLPAVVGGVLNYNAVYPIPIQFATSVYFNVVGGNVTVGIVAAGVEQ